MNNIGVLILCISILFIVTGYIQINNSNNNKVKIEYRYIPRTFEQEQLKPQKLNEIFDDLFEEPSLWLAGHRFGTNNKRMQPKKVI
jgi:hypothetical protein